MKKSKKRLIKQLQYYKNKFYKNNDVIAYTYIKNAILTLKGD